MPFAPEFDDVYSMIETSVESVIAEACAAFGSTTCARPVELPIALCTNAWMTQQAD
jgi:hypothetical protein